MKIILRPLETNDAERLATLANNIKIATNLTDQFPHPYHLEDANRFISMTMNSSPRNVLCIEVNKELIGAIGIHPQNDVWKRNAELGYWLAEDYWGKGIMTEAIQQMVTYGFNNFDIERIFARPFGRNIASQRVLEKTGFTMEARLKGTIVKNGRVEDECIYGMRRLNV